MAHSNCYFTFISPLEILTAGELFDRIVDSPGGHFTEKDAAHIMGQVRKFCTMSDRALCKEE